MPQRINDSSRTRAIEFGKQTSYNTSDQRRNSGIEDNSVREDEGLLAGQRDQLLSNQKDSSYLEASSSLR